MGSFLHTIHDQGVSILADAIEYSKINEASYLSADNFQRYRTIMHYFYEQHRKMNDLLYRGDVLEYMQSLVGFEGYSEKELDQDLTSLVGWQNLETRQEMSEPKSIAEYKNKHFRYQISETSIAIEEMLEKLSGKTGHSRGALDKNTFERFLSAIRELDQQSDEKELLNIWQDTVTHFTSIKSNTSDYIGYLNSERTESQMQTEAFLVFKDQFVFYLRDFIVTMQNTSYQIQHALQGVSKEKLLLVARCVVNHEKEIPRFDDTVLDEGKLTAELFGIWDTMLAWFIDGQGKSSEYSSLMKQTNQAISKITRMIQRFSDRMQQHQSRKKDYIHLADWFLNCRSVEEAHQLSSQVFGAFHSQHYYVKPSETSNKFADIWDIPATVHETIPRIRAYRERTSATAFTRNTQAKKEAVAAHLKQRQELEKSLQHYIQNGKIDLIEHPFMDASIRKLLLKWLSLSFQNEERTIATEFGQIFAIKVDRSVKVRLESEDGFLEMPNVVYMLIDKENTGGDRNACKQ